jgi:hypothetical protein
VGWNTLTPPWQQDGEEVSSNLTSCECRVLSYPLAHAYMGRNSKPIFNNFLVHKYVVYSWHTIMNFMDRLYNEEIFVCHG